MFQSQDSTQFKNKAQTIRQYFLLFKQSIIKNLEYVEIQIEKIILEYYQKCTNEQNSGNTLYPSKSAAKQDEKQPIQGSFEQNCYSNENNNLYINQLGDVLIGRIKRTLQGWEDQIKEFFSIDERIVPNQSTNTYRFLNQCKFPSIKISDDAQIIEQTSTLSNYCFAVIGEQLSEIGTSTIQFKCPKFVGDIGVGVCDLNTLRKKDFKPQLNQIGNGAFVCFQDLYTINNEKEELNWKLKGFKFDQYDLLEVTYDPIAKTIIWKRQRKEQYKVVITYKYDDLYFCVVVKSEGATVAIVQEE